MSHEILPIVPLALNPRVLREVIYPDLSHDLYWSDDWDPAFYVRLARAGFISICEEFDGHGCLLLPQLQAAYALLEWPNLRPSAAVRRLLRSGHIAETGAYLTLGTDVSEVVTRIVAAYPGACWLYPPYRTLLRQLEAERGGDFQLFAVELRAGSGSLIGGELGYAIGATYTSLTGFLDRSDRTWNHYGKLQLYALAAVLESHGYAFWNLGQPQMQYKRDLGAAACPRPEFLARWLPASVAEPAVGLGDAVGRRFPCDVLLNEAGVGRT